MEMRTSAETDKIVAAIIAVMNSCDFIKKHGKNDYHGYTYVQEADLIAGLRPEMVAQGLCYMPYVKESRTRTRVNHKGKEFAITSMLVDYTLYHTSGQWISACVEGQGEDEADKGGYKAMTGATKYFLHKAFMIATGDDPEQFDSKANGGDSKPQETRPPSNDTFSRDDDMRKPPANRTKYKKDSDEVQKIWGTAKEMGINGELFQYICKEIGIKGWTGGIGANQLKKLDEAVGKEITEGLYSNKYSESKKGQSDG